MKKREIKMQNPIDYVEALEIQDEDAHDYPHMHESNNPLFSDDASAQVNLGSLTSFVKNVAGQKKEDVMNSTLLAQLAANKAHDRYYDPFDWYKKYTEVLDKIGWNVPPIRFQKYSSKGTTVKLDESIQEILEAIATGKEYIDIVTATMKALQACDPNSKALTIWNNEAAESNTGNFQILPVKEEDNGQVVMQLIGMQFTAKSSKGGFLWDTWESSNIEIMKAVAQCELNESVYITVRQAIVEKLGDRAKKYVADLDIVQ